MNRIIFYIFIIYLLTSCTEKRYLSDSEAKFMPYKSGDALALVNILNEEADTIFINKIDRYVPDGPQIHFNETISALDESGRQIVSVSAGYLKYSEPYLSIKGLDGRQSLKEIYEKPAITFETRNSVYDDVVILEAKNKQSITNKVIRVHWSKSAGIIQFEETESGIWQLVSLKSSERN